MTITEMMVVGGGLLLGYWLVAVLLPALSQKKENERPHTQEPKEDSTEAPRSEQEPFAENQNSPPQSPPSRDCAWFEVLEVAATASQQEIQAAYKLQISRYHPDKVARMGIDIRRLAEAKSKAINAAYDEATSGH